MPNPKQPRSPCLTCGGEPATARYKYCSNKCQADFQYAKYIAAWKAGVKSGVQGRFAISNHLRRYLIEKHGEACQRCGWNERHPKTGRVPLNVEHIDGRWNNCREDNLLLLCPNCHSLTLTFGNLNRGNGRSARYSKDAKAETQNTPL